MGNLRVILLITLVVLLSPRLTRSFSSDNPTDRRILVVVDDASIKSSHSIFFNSLQSRGFVLEFKLANDTSISVQRYGKYLYDGLILFSPSVEKFGGSLDLAAILDFVDSGGDLILDADANASDLIRNVVAECGVDFDEDTSAVVIDHSSYAVSEIEGDHTLIASNNFIKSNVVLGCRKNEDPVLFRGNSHSLNPENMQLGNVTKVFKVLSASTSAYSVNPKSKLLKPPSLAGSSISLVSTMQARNGARVLISGSLTLFSDRFYRSGVLKAGSSTKWVKFYIFPNYLSIPFN